jgi:hypothetical protein
MGSAFTDSAIHGFKIFEKKIVYAVNIYKLFFLLLYPKTYSMTTLYICGVDLKCKGEYVQFFCKYYMFFCRRIKHPWVLVFFRELLELTLHRY